MRLYDGLYLFTENLNAERMCQIYQKHLLKFVKKFDPKSMIQNISMQRGNTKME